MELVKETFPNNNVINAVVKDDKNEIKSILNIWVRESIHVILTTGGTGFAPRDVTPEATQEVIDRYAPGIALAMMIKGLESTKLAALSRAVCGISNKTLIINFPGKINAVIESFESIKNVIPHAVALINDDLNLVQAVHNSNKIPVQIVRPNQTEKSKVLPVSSATRPRVSPYPLVELDKALEIIRDKIPAISDYEIISIDNAMGRKLADNIFSEDPLPSFRSSIKDGYAVNLLRPKPSSAAINESFSFPAVPQSRLPAYKIIKNLRAGDSLVLSLHKIDC